MAGREADEREEPRGGWLWLALLLGLMLWGLVALVVLGIWLLFSA